VKDLPVLIMEADIRRLAREIGDMVDVGKLAVDLHYFGPPGGEPCDEAILFAVALALIKKNALLN